VTRWVKLALVPAAVVWLASCTGSLFSSKAVPPVVYLLSAGPGSPGTGAQIPADLAVLKPRVRTGLESDRIAVLYADRHLDYLADARWSGPLGEVLQDLAVQELHSHVNLRTVSTDGSVFASAYWLEFEVADFQAEYTSAGTAPVVRVRFLARIGSSGDRHILGQFSASAQQPAAENRLNSIVDAYARASDAALAQIAVHAGELLAGASETR
jgi:cholesterol transport system auxiliary component